MRKKIAECMCVDTLIHNMEKKKARILKDTEYVEECELRIEQVKLLLINQVTIKDIINS